MSPRFRTTGHKNLPVFKRGQGNPSLERNGYKDRSLGRIVHRRSASNSPSSRASGENDSITFKKLTSRYSCDQLNGKQILRNQGYVRLKGKERKIKDLTGMNSEELNTVLRYFNATSTIEIDDMTKVAKSVISDNSGTQDTGTLSTVVSSEPEKTSEIYMVRPWDEEDTQTPELSNYENFSDEETEEKSGLQPYENSSSLLSSDSSSYDTYKPLREILKREKQKARTKVLDMHLCSNEEKVQFLVETCSPRVRNPSHEKKQEETTKRPDIRRLFRTNSGEIISEHAHRLYCKDKRLLRTIKKQASGEEPEVLFKKKYIDENTKVQIMVIPCKNELTYEESEEQEQ
jgi:hypothetical protein